jgi:hypothetical protein
MMVENSVLLVSKVAIGNSVTWKPTVDQRRQAFVFFLFFFFFFDYYCYFVLIINSP